MDPQRDKYLETEINHRLISSTAHGTKHRSLTNEILEKPGFLLRQQQKTRENVTS